MDPGGGAGAGDPGRRHGAGAADPGCGEAARHVELRRLPGFAGFSAPDSRGEYRGLDVDYCRALAAAVLGDPTKVRFVPLTAQDRFTALQTGEIDVLSRNSTQTFLRDNSLGLRRGR